MQNLNQAIRLIRYLTRSFCNNTLPLILFSLTINIQNGFCQSQGSLPEQFKSLSINSRALQKTTKVTASKDSSETNQSIVLDKTGVILHLSAPLSLLSNNTIRVFSDDGEETEIFNFIDGTLFALVDPQNSYSIIQEIKPNCDELIKKFSYNSATTICPDTIAYKLYENIMISSDTSYKIFLSPPIESYSIPINLPANTSQLDDSFNIVEILVPQEPVETELNVEQLNNKNTANLLTQGKLCLVSSTKSAPISKISECSFVNKDVKVITVFKENFSQNKTFDKNLNLVLPFPGGIFKFLNHELLFNLRKGIESKDPKIEISKQSKKKFFLNNYNYDLKLNLGQIAISKNRIKKNIFTLKTPVELNKTLNKTTVNIPFTKLEAIINPFNDTTKDSVLTAIEISGTEKTNPNNFKVSIENNITLKNAEPTSTPSPTPSQSPSPNPTPAKLRVIDTNSTPQPTSSVTPSSTSTPSPSATPSPLSTPSPTSTASSQLQGDNVQITSYFPNDIVNLVLDRIYSYIEADTSPSIESNGKAIEITDNKSNIDLTFSKNFNNVDLTNPTDSLVLDIDKTSTFLNSQAFNDQVKFSGILTPPDFRRLLETDYRATIEISMTTNLNINNLLKINCSDLKTKDESPLTNSFQFSSIPSGEYNAIVMFDSDRQKLFERAGVIKPTEQSK